MNPKEYLNNIKVFHNTRIEEINNMIKNIDDCINNYNIQKQNCQAEIAKLVDESRLVDEIIGMIPDNSSI